MRKLVYTLALVLSLALLGTSKPVAADDCERGAGHGTGHFTSPTTADGVINLRLDDDTYYIVAHVTILTLIPQADGSLIGTASHTLEFHHGNSATGKIAGVITTSDNATFTPTASPGVYNLLNNSHIVSGTKEFRNAVGGFVFTGIANFANGTTDTPITAVICDK